MGIGGRPANYAGLLLTGDYARLLDVAPELQTEGATSAFYFREEIKMSYKQLTPEDVADVLNIRDDDELTGMQIAADMLSGIIRFSDDEISKLAAYKRVAVEYLITNDPAFAPYKDPVKTAKETICQNLINNGVERREAYTLCGLST
ncbi:MAG: hypothetical protein LBS19_06170 [Clostridiales bacterium]|nr:hypothetical protein [Clostridiales bacterium]